MHFKNLDKVNELNVRLQRLIKMRIHMNGGAYLYKNRPVTDSIVDDNSIFIDQETLRPILDIEIEAVKTQLRKLGVTFDEN